MMKRCVRCVIPDTRPDTHFVDGVCSACISYEKRPTIDWDARKAELVALLDRHDGRCIVPSSGGKDSHYQVLKLIELGARPVVVTATTCMLTDVGRRNLTNLARYAPTIEITPNRTVRAKLNRLGLTMVGDISWPEHVAIFSIPFQVACNMGIPLLFYGENPQAQYGGPPGSDEARQLTRRWRSEFGGFLGLRPADFIGIEGITTQDMAIYEFPSDDDIAGVGVEAHFLGQYLPWDSHENARVACEAGMQCGNTPTGQWPFENLDNAMTGLHDHGMYRKFGFGRLAAQVAVDIRSGRLTREDGLRIVADLDGAFPWLYLGVQLGTVADQIGMSVGEIIKTLDKFTDWSLFHGVTDGRPIIKQAPYEGSTI